MTTFEDPRYLGDLESSTVLDEEHERTQQTSSVPLRNTVHRHREYYFDDGNLVILVEDTLFRVFRSTFIRHSSVFSDLFSLPEPFGHVSEGSSDENPLFFSGILAADFERLLWVMYPPTYGVYKPTTLDEWTSILHLASRWELTDIRSLAIRSIQSLDITLVDRIVLSRDFELTGRWTLSAYIALCDRPDPLSYNEASRLGLETSVRIAQMREHLRSGTGRGGGYRSLTRAAAERRAATTPAPFRGGRNTEERPQWDIARSFLDQEKTIPPTRTNTASSIRRMSPSGKPGGAPALSRHARLVAEAFRIEIDGH